MIHIQSAQRKLEKKWATEICMKFANAVEASKVVDDLSLQARTLNYNKDLRKLIANAQKLVAELGSAEVRARQLHKPYLADKPRKELENAVDYIEKILLVLRLTQ